MSKRRILITGATGGLGAALVREALARGHHVVATGRSVVAGERLTAFGAKFAALDLTDPHADVRKLVRNCDSVIHAAALSASWGPGEAFTATNVDATTRLLAAAADEGLSRFVFVSSPSIFAGFADRIGIGEHDLPAAKPLNHYAQTKWAAEQLVLNQTHAALACCVVRPRALVGPGDQVILPRLAQLAARKRMPLLRGGMALIEMTDLRDAAWAICEAEERGPRIAGKAINISGGLPVPVRTIASRLSAALGKTPQFIPLPMILVRPLTTMVEAIARLRGTVREPVLTRYTLATLAYSQTFDPEPAQRLLGFMPRHDALETLCAQAQLRATTAAAQ